MIDHLPLAKRRGGLFALLLVCLYFFTACSMNDLPRNMRLKAFAPYRADFACVHEAANLPAVNPDAEVLFQQGMAATSYDLWPNQRDYKKAAELWLRAAQLGHWKAALNLAGLYESGQGVERDTEKAVLIVEDLMRKGVPAAFDQMGTYHDSGIGVRSSVDRAYAFWQLAAEMGNPAAQAYLGGKLDAAYTSSRMGIWGNSTVGIKMLECSFAQGYGPAAYRLAQSIEIDGKDYSRSLRIYHEGVKFGSLDCAQALSSSFRHQEPVTGNLIDMARADRYSTIGEALELNPDLRFPNLDKVLPLPPADLPYWDGKRQTLIDAAKPVLPRPPVQPTPGSQRTGRAHIPDGHLLAIDTRMTGVDDHGRARHTQARGEAHYPGYWLPQLLVMYGDGSAQRAWNAAQVPQRCAKGEAFNDANPPHRQVVTWLYQGQPVARHDPVHPLVAQGRVRVVPAPQKVFDCSATRPCPRTGIWEARVTDNAHPQYAAFHSRQRQAYVQQGEQFPAPMTLHAEGGWTLVAADLRWYWLGEPNRVEGMHTHVHVTQGSPA